MAQFHWKVAGVSVVGFSHVAEEIPCQDAHAVTVLPGGWLIAIVADGAGSAIRSAEGSRNVCDGVLAHLNSRLAEFSSKPDQIDERTIRSWIEEAIELVRNKFVSLAGANGNSISDFHATLVGAVAGPNGGVFFHVGDGAACASSLNNLSKNILSLPENGEYANETYFVTQDEWRDHLRTLSFDSNYNLVALMSDGVTPFALTQGASGPSPPFFEPVSRFLVEHDRDESERALTTLLGRDAIRRVTGDDKTLILALRTEPDGQLLS